MREEIALLAILGCKASQLSSLLGARYYAIRGLSSKGPLGEVPERTWKAVFSEILCWVVKPPWFRESGLPGNETLG
jgi:hypothetical protein